MAALAPLSAFPPFGAALTAGCALIVILYLAMTRIGPRFGLKL